MKDTATMNGKPDVEFFDAAGRPYLQPFRKRIASQLPARHVKVLKETGSRYLHWHTVANLLDYTTNGFWSTKIMEDAAINNEPQSEYVVRLRITIHAAEGDFSHEGVGSSPLNRVDRNGEIKPIAYGSAYTNAYAQAFKRTAAMHGAGRYLYAKEDDRGY